MSSYYGVTRSSEYLAHYGVKGMKWGVRKAKETGNSKALDRHWRKANRKLNRLNKKANWVAQQKRSQKGENALAIGATLGAAATAGTFRSVDKIPKRYMIPALVGSATAPFLGALPGYMMMRKAGKRLTSAGHKKAQSESESWANEMNKAFVGTKYRNKAKPNSDIYLFMKKQRIPSEAKYGNAMPYRKVIYAVTGTDLAKERDILYGHGSKKRRRT